MAFGSSKFAGAKFAGAGSNTTPPPEPQPGHGHIIDRACNTGYIEDKAAGE